MEQTSAAPGREVVDLVDAALRARGAVTPEDACALLAPLPAAIEAARDAGTTLRLPRGTNRETRAAIAALGLASAPRARAGEPLPFRAPEQVADATPTPASDVYAVAGLLRTAVTGHEPPPWTLANLAANADAPNLAGAFGAVLWDGLADDPALRPASPQALLEAATAALTAPAPPLDDDAAVPPETRRLRRIAAATGGAFLIGLILAVSSGGDDAPEPERIAVLPAAPAPAASGTDDAFAADMAQAMRRLNVRRVARRERLRAATTLPGQASSATALADAFGIAARSAGRAPAPADARENAAAVVDALLLVESGYRTMARGARDGDRAQYNRGRDAVRGREALLQRRIQRLGQSGYRIG